jgi:hypothetical protein
MSLRDAAERAAAWLCTQREAFGPGLRLAIGGPRESEANGIYREARAFLQVMLGRPTTGQIAP